MPEFIAAYHVPGGGSPLMCPLLTKPRNSSLNPGQAWAAFSNKPSSVAFLVVSRAGLTPCWEWHSLNVSTPTTWGIPWGLPYFQRHRTHCKTHILNRPETILEGLFPCWEMRVSTGDAEVSPGCSCSQVHLMSCQGWVLGATRRAPEVVPGLADLTRRYPN